MTCPFPHKRHAEVLTRTKEEKGKTWYWCQKHGWVRRGDE